MNTPIETTKVAELLLQLVEALGRQGTVQDGNWGYPSTSAEIARIAADLRILIEGKV